VAGSDTVRGGRRRQAPHLRDVQPVAVGRPETGLAGRRLLRIGTVNAGTASVVTRAGLIVTRPLSPDPARVTMVALHRRQARTPTAIAALLTELQAFARLRTDPRTRRFAPPVDDLPVPLSG
jgi:hypothetical protein